MLITSVECVCIIFYVSSLTNKFKYTHIVLITIVCFFFHRLPLLLLLLRLPLLWSVELTWKSFLAYNSMVLIVTFVYAQFYSVCFLFPLHASNAKFVTHTMRCIWMWTQRKTQADFSCYSRFLSFNCHFLYLQNKPIIIAHLKHFILFYTHSVQRDAIFFFIFEVLRGECLYTLTSV